MRVTVLLLSFVLLGSAVAKGYALREVVFGDSLALIAGRYGVDVSAVRDLNGVDGNTIYPQQLLRVPVGEATARKGVSVPAPPPGFRRHAVVPDDTLSSLAESYEIGLESLIGANPDLSSMDRLPVGIELLIPNRVGLVVTFNSGRELVELAERHGVDPVAMVVVNELASPLDLHPGMLLFLPDVRPTAALERLVRVRELENLFVWPVHGRITSYFGRRNLGLGTSSFHRGIDVAAPHGTPIFASRRGTVSFAGWSNQGYGYLVKIRHLGGAETWYAHQSQILVEPGQHVAQGELIGRLGSSGLSTGPHLHFELHKKGAALDPLTELN